MFVITGLLVRHTYGIPIQRTDIVIRVQVITIPTVVLRWCTDLPSGSTDPVILSGGNGKPCYGSHLVNPGYRIQKDS